MRYLTATKGLALAALATVLPSMAMAANDASEGPAYEGSRFSDVWSAVQAQPYEELPQFQVTTASFFGILKDRLEQSARRTLSDKSDLLPPFRKLLHANGVCLAGTWNITEPTPYTGYFRQGSQGLIVVRASAALSEVRKGEKRSLGLAGKIFPTTNPDHGERLETANFFVIDNLGGTYVPRYLDTAMTNDLSGLTLGVDNAPNLVVAAAAGRAIAAAELALSGGNPLVRQLYPIAELGEATTAQAVTPRFLKIQGRPGPRSDAADFRDELREAVLSGPLVFDIYVGREAGFGQGKTWDQVGYIELTEAVASKGCDQQLHFHHPKWRRDLTHE